MKSLLKTKLSLNDYLIILLLVFGLLSPIALLLNLRTVLGIGVISQAAPLAFAYTKLNGVEQYANKSYFELHLKNGETLQVDNTQELFSKFKGFYYKKATYGASILYGSGFIFRQQGPIVNSTLKKGLCANGPMASLLRLTSEVHYAKLEILEKDNGPGRWVREINCDN